MVCSAVAGGCVLGFVPVFEAFWHSCLFAHEVFHALVGNECAAGDHLADVIAELFEVRVFHVAVRQCRVVRDAGEVVAVDVDKRRDCLVVENLADDVEVAADCH